MSAGGPVNDNDVPMPFLRRIGRASAPVAAVAREAIANEVERLIGLLDVLDGDPDHEHDLADDEPSLGSFDRMADQRKSWLQRADGSSGDDREQDDADREDGGDG